MEPESSLPYSQAPATCPYPEPTPSSPHNPFALPEDPSYYYPPIYVFVSPMVYFPQVSPPKSCAHLSLPPYLPHAPPISFSKDHILNINCCENLEVRILYGQAKTPIFNPEAYSSEILVVPNKPHGATFGNDRTLSIHHCRTSNLTSQYPYSGANLMN